MAESIASESPQAIGPVSIRIVVERDFIPSTFSLLQQGFLVKTRVGCSIEALLTKQIGLSPEYLEERVQTTFLDGKAVDNLSSTIVTEGCTLALSAAMPGFVGAAFRKGGYYAVMRAASTHVSEEGTAREGEQEKSGFITLKLFNLVARELGEYFMERGILLEAHALISFLKTLPEDFWAHCKETQVNAAPVDRERLRSSDWLGSARFVILQVVAREG